MRRISLLVLPVAAALTLLLPPTASPAATLEPIGGFDRPIFVTSDPADPDRLLVVEREGRVLVAGESGFELFGELEALVSCCMGERGLLSIALAPDFATTERFYAAYAGTAAAGGAEGDIHLDAFRPAPAGGGELVRERILTVGHADAATHNGGQLQFGPDGRLYLSTGDGGGAGDPEENGQDLDSLLGKLLRIEPLPGSTPSYAIPSGNPFVGAGGLDEIWAYGLRNPWRFSFDRANGDLIVADVGQGLREEVDHALSPAPGTVGGAGANYGWNCREGSIAFPNAPASCLGVGGFTDPVFDYPHADPGGEAAHGCAITGGYVVRDSGLGDLFGRYLYADFCIGELRSLVLPSAAGAGASGDRSEGLAVANPVSFGEDACGRLYVVSNGGAVFRLQGDAGPACPPPPAEPDPPAGPTPAVEATPAAGGGPLPARRHHLALRVRRLGRGVELTARVLPCDGVAGSPVQLNRGGRPIRRKRLDERCSARFRLRFVGRATFRAVFEGQRSQVRTIALAKPRP